MKRWRRRKFLFQKVVMHNRFQSFQMRVLLALSSSASLHTLGLYRLLASSIAVNKRLSHIPLQTIHECERDCARTQPPGVGGPGGSPWTAFLDMHRFSYYISL